MFVKARYVVRSASGWGDSNIPAWITETKIRKKLPLIAEVSDFTCIDTGNVVALFGAQ